MRAKFSLDSCAAGPCGIVQRSGWIMLLEEWNDRMASPGRAVLSVLASGRPMDGPEVLSSASGWGGEKDTVPSQSEVGSEANC